MTACFSKALHSSLDLVYRKKKNICSFFHLKDFIAQVSECQILVKAQLFFTILQNRTLTGIKTAPSKVTHAQSLIGCEVVPCTHFCKHSGERPCTQYSLCCYAREVKKACGERKKPKLGSLRGGRLFNRDADIHSSEQ